MIRLDEQIYPLAAVHPWVKKCDTKQRWQLWRACMDEFEDAAQKREFLPKGKYEQDVNYTTRIELTEYLGVSPQVNEQIVGAVFGSNPVLETKSGRMKEWLKDCDGCGTLFAELMEEASGEAAGMGVSYIRIDGPANVARVASREDEIENGTARAFADILRAEDVINWSHDDDGALLWASVIQLVHEQASADAPRKFFVELTIYDRTSLTRYRLDCDDTGKPNEKAVFVKVNLLNPVHSLGVVPVFPVYGVRRGHMMGDPLTRGAARADKVALNNESWLAVAMYRHANPILKLVTSREVDAIMSGAVARIMPDETLEYVETPESAFDSRIKQIERVNAYGEKSAGMKRDTQSSANPKSGIAMRVEFTQTQKKAIDKHARFVTSAARRALEVAEKFVENTATSSVTQVQFKSTFDVQESREVLSNLSAAQLAIDSPTLHRELAKQAASKLVGDLGPEVMKKINGEIDAGETVPDAPTDRAA